MTGFYDLPLLVLSWGVATLASLAFLRIARALPRMAPDVVRRWWLQGAAVAGAGFWAAHVVGLLAYRLPIDAPLGPVLLAAAVVPAWIGTGAALKLMGGASGAARGLPALAMVATALAAGAGAMQFIGASAWQISPYVGHDVPLRLASLTMAACLVAVVLVRMDRRTATPSDRAVLPWGAAALGAVVVMLQMAGVAAVRVQPDSIALAPGPGIAGPWIAALVATAASAGIGLLLVALSFETRRVLGDGGSPAGEATQPAVVPAEPVTVAIPPDRVDADTMPHTALRELASGPVVVFRTDPEHPDVLARFSANAGPLWGYGNEALGATTALADLFHEQDWNADRTAQWRRRFGAGAVRITEDLRVRRADGVYRWHQLSLAPDGVPAAPGGPRAAPGSAPPRAGWVGHLVDVDERKHGELHAHAQIRRLAELADGQRDASRDAALLEDTREMLHLAETLPEAREIIRRACARLLPGWSGALTRVEDESRACVTARWGDRVPMVDRFGPRDCWALRSHRVHRFTAPAEHALCTHVVHDAAEAPPPHFCLPIVDHREALGAVHLFAPHGCDVDEAEALRPRMDALARMLGQAFSNLRLRLALREQAMRDALTGLYQGRFLQEELPAELQRAHRERRAVCVAILDIDGLGTYNERHGREAGDGVLVAVGRILNGSLRGYDTACRVGGEEIVLVLPGCELEDALIRLEEIRCSVEALRLEHGGVPLPVVTISVGIAEARGGAADALMLRATEALQRAKQNGRNRIEIAEREGPVLA
jgi:diguanylate cyclase (GGDEF)-like protein